MCVQIVHDDQMLMLASSAYCTAMPSNARRCIATHKTSVHAHCVTCCDAIGEDTNANSRGRIIIIIATKNANFFP